jgi:pilus assembly protein CpaB
MSGRFTLRMLLFSSAALALGGGTFLLAQNLLQDRVQAARSQAGVQPPAVTKVLVAARALNPGTSVKTGDLVWRDWPASTGEPVTAKRLVAPGSRSVLAAMTDPGSRAVSISLNPTSGVSGLVMPGDRVDVVLTYALPRVVDAAGGSVERRAAETILSDLRVLAVDQRLSGAASDAKEIRNASLEVTAHQSEVLALAADLGKLSLSLRGLERSTGEAVATASTATVDYQVGRLLPRLSARVAGHAEEQRRQPREGHVLVEFHGSAHGAGQPH